MEIIKSKLIAQDKFTSKINSFTSAKEIFSKENLFNNKKKRNTKIFIDSTEKYKELLEITYDEKNQNIDYIEKQKNQDFFQREDIAEIIKKKNIPGGINNINNKVLKILNINQIYIFPKHLVNATALICFQLLGNVWLLD